MAIYSLYGNSVEKPDDPEKKKKVETANISDCIEEIEVTEIRPRRTNPGPSFFSRLKKILYIRLFFLFMIPIAAFFCIGFLILSVIYPICKWVSKSKKTHFQYLQFKSSIFLKIFSVCLVACFVGVLHPPLAGIFIISYLALRKEEMPSLFEELKKRLSAFFNLG